MIVFQPSSKPPNGDDEEMDEEENQCSPVIPFVPNPGKQVNSELFPNSDRELPAVVLESRVGWKPGQVWVHRNAEQSRTFSRSE